jgi:hypothetical protein
MPPVGRQDQSSVGIALRDWEALAARLVPIIGQQGLGALFVRSLHLTAPAFPCLGIARSDEKNTIESLLTSLRQRLLTQPPVLAQAANRALLSTFTDLLGTLIGSALTAQLIQKAPPESGPEASPQGIQRRQIE